MPHTSTPTREVTGSRIDLVKLLGDVYDWLAGWAERNIEPGEDGLHIPRNARVALEEGCYYI